MDTMKICPGCHKPLAPDAPDGLCPECLVKAGLPSGMDIGPDSESGSGPVAFTAPALSEVARLFPQLEILGLIGQGGMGAVYRARQRELDRVVALKILPPDIGRDTAFAERFTREARALAKLNHPGIVTLYEFGRADGLFFFLMEYVDGVNLRQLLQAGRVSPREALGIVPQICDALQYAHDHGIVHRDIKPENILVDRHNRVKVADFGLAKLVGQANESGAQTVGVAFAGSVLTEAGKVMGTPQYMAPEQREHPNQVDHRADIYSLGVVFYQMLTGELPGKPVEPPSARVQGARLDLRLDEVVLRALQKEPERRYQHVSEVKTDVENIAATRPSSAGAGSRSPAPPVRILRWRDLWMWDPAYFPVYILAPGILATILFAVLMPHWGLKALWVFALELAGIAFAVTYSLVGRKVRRRRAELPRSSGEVAEALIVQRPYQSPGLAVLHEDRLELVPIMGASSTVRIADIEALSEVRWFNGKRLWSKRGFVMQLHDGQRVGVAVPETFACRWRARLSRGRLPELPNPCERQEPQPAAPPAPATTIKPNNWEAAIMSGGLMVLVMLLVIAFTTDTPMREFIKFNSVLGLCICALSWAGCWPFPSFGVPDSGFCRRNLRYVGALSLVAFISAFLSGLIPTIFFWLAPWLVPWLTPLGQEVMLWLTFCAAFIAVMTGISSRRAGIGRTGMIVGAVNLALWLLFFLAGALIQKPQTPPTATETSRPGTAHPASFLKPAAPASPAARVDGKTAAGTNTFARLPEADRSRALSLFNDIENFSHEFEAAFAAKSLPAARIGVSRLVNMILLFNEAVAGTGCEFSPALIEDINQVAEALNRGDWESARRLARHNETHAREFKRISTEMVAQAKAMNWTPVDTTQPASRPH